MTFDRNNRSLSTGNSPNSRYVQNMALIGGTTIYKAIYFGYIDPPSPFIRHALKHHVRGAYNMYNEHVHKHGRSNLYSNRVSP